MEKNGLLKDKKNIVSFNNMLQYFLVEYYVVVTIVYLKSRDVTSLLYSLLLIVPCVLSFLLQRKAKHLYSFLLGHAMFMVGGFLMGRSGVEKIVFLCFTAFLGMTAWWMYVDNKKRFFAENASLLLLATTLPFILAAYYKKCQLLYELYTFVVILVLWINMLNRHLANRYQYLSMQVQTSGVVEMGKLNREGNKVLGGISAGAVLVLLFGAQVKAAGVIYYLLDLIRQLIYSLLALRPEGKIEEYHEEEIINSIQPTIEPKGVSEHNWALELFGEILIKIVQFMCLVFVILVVYFFCYGVWKKFHEKEVNLQEDYVEREEKITKVVRSERKKKRTLVFGDNNQKLRRIFRKRVLQGEKIKQSKKRNKTSMELVELVREDARAGLTDMVPVYQKARYSGKVISKKELEKCGKM